MAQVDGSARRGEALVQAGMALASDLSLPSVLQKIVDLACEVADARFGALGIVGPEGGIEDFVTHGVTDAERQAIGRLPEGRGILGVLLRDPRPLRLRRIQDHPASVGFPPNHPRMTSFLGVPIRVRDRVFGNLYLAEKRGVPEFTEDDERAVVTLAAQAGVAVENARLYRDAQTAQHRLAAINEVSQAILEGRPTDDVLGLIARRARELVRADLATIAAPEADGDHLAIRVADGARAGAVLGARFPAKGSMSGQVMRTGRPLAVPDASADERVHQPVVRIGGIGPALFVPLAVRDRVLGTLAVANHTGRAPFSDDDLALVRTFAAQAAVALEYARMQEELQRLAVVEERERIAKELHDDIIQSLFAEGMGLQAAQAMVGDPDAVQARLAEAVDHIDRIIRDLRNYIFGLRLGEVADRQLERALREIAEGFEKGAVVALRVEIDPDAGALLAGRAVDIAQAAREALSNAVRHSGGDEVALRLARDGRTAVLTVEDNGKGFDVGEAAGRGHGLANLRSRAAALNGALEIDSAPGRGTRVRIRIPL